MTMTCFISLGMTMLPVLPLSNRPSVLGNTARAETEPVLLSTTPLMLSTRPFMAQVSPLASVRLTAGKALTALSSEPCRPNDRFGFNKSVLSVSCYSVLRVKHSVEYISMAKLRKKLETTKCFRLFVGIWAKRNGVSCRSLPLSPPCPLCVLRRLPPTYMYFFKIICLFVTVAGNACVYRRFRCDK